MVRLPAPLLQAPARPPQAVQVLLPVEVPVVPRVPLPQEDLPAVPVHPHRVAQVLLPLMGPVCPPAPPRAQDLPAAQVPHRVVDRLPAPVLLPRAILAPHPAAGLPALPVLLLAVDLPAALVPLLPAVQVLLLPLVQVCHQVDYLLEFPLLSHHLVLAQALLHLPVQYLLFLQLQILQSQWCQQIAT